MAAELKPPLIFVGATRSGKSTISRLVSQVTGATRWSEPNALLRTGHAYRRSHASDARDATPWVKRRIRRICLEHQQANGGRPIVIDADGYAVLKIPFLHEVFPDSKFIHVFRDGRMTSAVRMHSDSHNQAFELRNTNARRRMLGQLRQMCWWEIPAYAPRFVDSMIRRYLLKRPITWQGIKYDGWRQDRDRLSRYELQVKQWRISVEAALASLEKLQADAWINVRFEDFLSEPGHWLRKIVDFAGLPRDEAALDEAEHAVHERSATERSPTPPDGENADAAMALAEPLLRRLGYL